MTSFKYVHLWIDINRNPIVLSAKWLHVTKRNGRQPLFRSIRSTRVSERGSDRLSGMQIEYVTTSMLLDCCTALRSRRRHNLQKWRLRLLRPRSLHKSQIDPRAEGRPSIHFEASIFWPILIRQREATSITHEGRKTLCIFRRGASSNRTFTLLPFDLCVQPDKHQKESYRFEIEPPVPIFEPSSSMFGCVALQQGRSSHLSKKVGNG